MWRTMQAEPSTSVPYMAHDAVKVLMEAYESKIDDLFKNSLSCILFQQL